MKKHFKICGLLLDAMAGMAGRPVKIGSLVTVDEQAIPACAALRGLGKLQSWQVIAASRSQNRSIYKEVRRCSS